MSGTREERRSRWWTASLVVSLGIWTFGPLSFLLNRAVGSGSEITGADGPFPADQLQYMAWIRDGSNRGLAGSLYDFDAGPAVFLQPMFAISSVVYRVGDNLQISLLIWKPVAIAALVVGATALARRVIPGPAWACGIASALALFFATPTSPLLHALGVGDEQTGAVDGLAGEALVSGLTWGYLPAAIASGLMPLYILGLERIVRPEHRPERWSAAQNLVATAALGMAAAWLHPWQGQTLLLITAGVVLWSRRFDWIRALAFPVVATLLPLLYYVALAQLSGPWELAAAVNDRGPGPLWAFVAVIAPLAVPAALGLPRFVRDADVAEQALVLWPVAAAGSFLVVRAFPTHFLQGVGIPLSILAVRACLKLPRQLRMRAAVVGLLLLTIPGLVQVGNSLRREIERGRQPFLVSADEQDAMNSLASSDRRGGVLSTLFLGSAVPAYTGRETYVGHPNWTPGFAERAQTADALLNGRLDAAAAQDLIRSLRPAFVLARCGEAVSLEADLYPILTGVHRFGCVTVFEIDA